MWTDVERVADRIISELHPNTTVALSASPDTKLFGQSLTALIEAALSFGKEPDDIGLRELKMVADWIRYDRGYGVERPANW